MEELTLHVITEQRPGGDILIGVFTNEAFARKVRRRFSSDGATIRVDTVLITTVVATPPAVEERDWRGLLEVTKTAQGSTQAIVGKDQVGVEDAEGVIPSGLQTPVWIKVATNKARTRLGVSGTTDANLYTKVFPVMNTAIANNELPPLEV